MPGETLSARLDAKDWNADKQKVILPTLLCGKLLNCYAECSKEIGATENFTDGKSRFTTGQFS